MYQPSYINGNGNNKDKNGWFMSMNHNSTSKTKLQFQYIKQRVAFAEAVCMYWVLGITTTRRKYTVDANTGRTFSWQQIKTDFSSNKM